MLFVACDSCESFIADWLNLPPAADEPQLLRWKTVAQLAPYIAKQFFRIYMKISPVSRIFVEEEQLRKLRIHMYSDGLHKIIDQGSDGEFLLQAIEDIVGKEDTDALQTMLEDTCTVKKGVVRKWIALWTVNLWKVLHEVHMEHRKIVKVSYGGAAHGLRSVRKGQGLVKPVFKQSIEYLMNSVLPPVSATAGSESKSPGSPREERRTADLLRMAEAFASFDPYA